jgi:hypothetical protein
MGALQLDTTDPVCDRGGQDGIDGKQEDRNTDSAIVPVTYWQQVHEYPGPPMTNDSPMRSLNASATLLFALFGDPDRHFRDASPITKQAT